MTSGSRLTAPASGSPPASHFERWAFRLVAGAVLVYAFLAGLRTVTDYDLGWQMATGRWVILHRAVPSVDVFSYTAAGTQWIYPLASGVLFYALFLVGGYALLSWLGAAACVATTALLLRRGTFTTAALALLAIPRIATRTTPRADMFTVVFFAAFLSLLWQQYQTGRARLWLLPLLMTAWVNLHLGFISGLALIAAYAGSELLRRLSGDADNLASSHLRRAWPWLIATCAATLLNPWGWNLYRAVLRQQQAMTAHAQWIAEWASQPLTWQSILTNYSPFTVLLAFSVIAAILALLQRQVGPALLLVGATFIATRYVRMQALFACVVVIVGGAILHRVLENTRTMIADSKMRVILAAGAAAMLVLFAGFSSSEIATDRYYFGRTSTANFGVGLSWWFPERAAAFIARNQLPRQIFNVYNEGGYLTWKLGPAYPDYIDGRAIPFGSERFERVDALTHADPDSAEWQEEADQYGINTLLIPLGRYEGLSLFPKLRQFCRSDTWRPVYLDEVSAVFLRNTPANQELIKRLGISCEQTPLPPGISPGRAQAFAQLSNAAGILYALGRRQEALAASSAALNIFPDSAILHFVRAKSYLSAGMWSQAEEDYLTAAALEPNDAIFSELAQLYANQGQPERALQVLAKAAAYSRQPYFSYLTLGEAYLQAQQPRDAIRAFDLAEREAPAKLASTKQNVDFLVRLAVGRAAAWAGVQQPLRALPYQEQAVRLRPDDPELWQQLANLYRVAGRPEDAARARARVGKAQGQIASQAPK